MTRMPQNRQLTLAFAAEPAKRAYSTI